MSFSLCLDLSVSLLSNFQGLSVLNTEVIEGKLLFGSTEINDVLKQKITKRFNNVHNIYHNMNKCQQTPT